MPDGLSSIEEDGLVGTFAKTLVIGNTALYLEYLIDGFGVDIEIGPTRVFYVVIPSDKIIHNQVFLTRTSCVASGCVVARCCVRGGRPRNTGSKAILQSEREFRLFSNTDTYTQAQAQGLLMRGILHITVRSYVSIHHSMWASSSH